MKIQLQKNIQSFVTNVINPMGPASISERCWEAARVVLGCFSGLANTRGTVANTQGSAGLGRILVRWKMCGFFLLLQRHCFMSVSCFFASSV